jgi:hypothetical protein
MNMKNIVSNESERKKHPLGEAELNPRSPSDFNTVFSFNLI